MTADQWEPWREAVLEAAAEGYEAKNAHHALAIELATAQVALEKARGESLRAELHRRQVIRQALEAGVKQADIARITGLSRARIAQLR